jgi:hypothetical protein
VHVELQEAVRRGDVACQLGRPVSFVGAAFAEGVGLLALRFTNDPLCRAERFERLRRELGDAVETIEIDSSPGNAHGLPQTAHSVVTRELVDREGHPTHAALERVLGFFRERLAA